MPADKAAATDQPGENTLDTRTTLYYTVILLSGAACLVWAFL